MCFTMLGTFLITERDKKKYNEIWKNRNKLKSKSKQLLKIFPLKNMREDSFGRRNNLGFYYIAKKQESLFFGIF